ncbi:MAG: hypothetical protein CMC63_09965 [Flavobacteriaceae bacterium]|nr:hypothetical protein [Flavobacteriaceae bacterium]|tara:strand:- start:639 stop:971 length:333 start_codon:yes stop_codon:yes gene_type:complete
MLSKKLYLFIISINIFIAHANELTKPKITIFKTPTHEQKNVSYNNGSIFLKGFDGPGSIEVYSIIGNKITEVNTQNLYSFQFEIELETGNMYIIRIVSLREVNTFKIVAS